MKDINNQIVKLEQELAELKKIVNKPKGIILSEPLKDLNGNFLKLNFDNANTLAKLLGTRLPTKKELENLTEEQKELYKNECLWSSESNGYAYAWYFYGSNGFVFNDVRPYKRFVRCVLGV